MPPRRRPGLRIDTLQRGGDRSALPALEGAARFYLSRLASTRLLNTLDVRIECRVVTRPLTSEAAFTLEPGPARPKSFTITLPRDTSLERKLIALAHECVKVRQRAQGDLVVRRDGRVSWRGEDYTGTDPRIQPWLIQCFALQPALLDSLKLAVLDDTLNLGVDWRPSLG